MHRLVLRGAAALVLVLAGVAGLTSLAGAQAASIEIAPTKVVPGGQISIGGSCDPDSGGFLLSDAFIGHIEFAGVPAVGFSTDSAGRFFVSFHIDKAVKPGTYTVGFRCGGGLVPITPHFEVVASSLPATGTDSRVVVSSGAALLLVGVGLTLIGRRRIAGI